MIEIFENFVPKQNQQQLLDYVNSSMFPWFWNENSTWDYISSDPREIHLTNLNEKYGHVNYPQFTHIVIKNDVINHESLNVFSKLLLDNLLNIGDPINRIKLNLNVPFNNYSKNCTGFAHFDSLMPLYNKSAIYYLNDSDGDTIFFKETYHENISELTVETSYTPKQGTLIIFDSNRLHASSLPSLSNKRMIVNIIFGRK